MNIPEYALENLLGYNGRKHILASGYYLKFEVRKVLVSKQVPHGIAYSFTLHEPEGDRILGFDNAHPVPHQGSKFIPPPVASDHWHRTRSDEGRPYKFESADKLLLDFFEEVGRALQELDVPFEVVEDKES